MIYDTTLPEDDNLSWRVFRTQMLLETGLPLEYFDNLGSQDVGDIMAFMSGRSKAEKKLRKRK